MSDQVHSSLVDILFYFTLFYFPSQICWNENKGNCEVIFVSHTHLTTQLCHLAPFQGIIIAKV